MSIVVGYVPTDEGVAALRLAAQESQQRRIPLVVVSSEFVSDPAAEREIEEALLRRRGATVGNSRLTRGGPVSTARPAESSRGSVVQRLQAEFEEARTRLDELGVTYEYRVLTEFEDPADAVLLAAAETGAACIVIGLRRRSPVGKLLMGSNAQRILLEARCPVIAVHADTV